MKQVTSLALANEVIAKLVSMIKYEYDLAHFRSHEYARNCANFDDKNRQRDYLLWSGGQFEVMKTVKEKTDKIFDEVFIDIINNMTTEEREP